MKWTAVGTNFAGFLDRVVPDGRDILAQIPRTTVNGIAERGHSFDQLGISLCLIDMPEQKGLTAQHTVYTFCDGDGACQATLLKRSILKLKRHILKDIRL